MNSIIIYRSKTGFTKKYAGWLAEKLGSNIVPYKNRNTVDFSGYDVIIYGGSIHAGGIYGLKWFKKQLPGWTNKKTVVFAVGGMPAGSPDIDMTLKRNFTEEESLKTKSFYLPGGYDYDKMGFFDKKMMQLFCKILEKRKHPTTEEKAAVEAMKHSCDNTDKKYLEPVVIYLKDNK